MKNLFLLFLFALVPALMGQDSRPVTISKITGSDEVYDADVELINGKNRLLTSSIVVIEQLFGRDNSATTWLYIGTDTDATGVGSAGDTVRVQIPAANTPLNVVYPAVDVTTTVTAACTTDPKPERCLALDICQDLNTDTNFLKGWKCEVIKDFSGVFISSRIFNEWGERLTWSATSTGTTVVTEAYDDIIRRGFSTELSRSPNNPRSGILAIAGSVISLPGGVGDIIIENFKSASLSPDLRVNGSTTPVDFSVNCSPDKDRLIEEIRLYAGCNGLKFGQFLCKNTDLANGIELTLVSEQNTLILPIIRSTEDFKNKFAFGGSGTGATFRIDIQAGGDQMAASYIFANPAILEKCGTNPSGDDYIQVRIRDRLDNINLNEFEALARGFEQEP
jgi:hypothetical protein